MGMQVNEVSGSGEQKDVRLGLEAITHQSIEGAIPASEAKQSDAITIHRNEQTPLQGPSTGEARGIGRVEVPEPVGTPNGGGLTRAISVMSKRTGTLRKQSRLTTRRATYWEQLRDLREDLIGQQERIGRLIARVDAQKAGIEEMLAAGPRQEPGRAFELAAGQAALVDDVDSQAAGQGAKKDLWKKIQGWLGTAGTKLWAMISHLARVKEWTLSGKVSTGLLGFAEASISVTFG